jgi:hypothetical protein
VAIPRFPLRSSGPHITPLRSTVNGKRAISPLVALTNVQLRCITDAVVEKSPPSHLPELSRGTCSGLFGLPNGM